MVRQVYQGTPEEQFNATQKFRKLLSIGKRRATRAAALCRPVIRR